MKTCVLVFSNPIEGKEAEYNDWYNNVHVKEVCKLEGFKSAQRFKLTEAQLMPDGQAYKYLAIYEIENDNVQDTINNLVTGKLNMQPVIDMANIKACIFQSITE